ncbi:MAG: DUF6249 domain-containing protein [Xanthomonadales bacterium]|nr:DUF6249 domain-containing protein [Xanthomonadales bacterium]
MTPDIFIPFVLMLAPVLIVLIVLRYRQQQTKTRYEALVQLAEKGVQLTPQLLTEPRGVYSERRRALVLIGTALGIMAMFLALPWHFTDGVSVASLWAIGLLPLMIGLGYLASWWLNRRDGSRD